MAISARIDELRKKFDENPRRYFAPLANEYRKSGDPGQAIFICETYLPQQPGHMSGHIVFGQALYELNRLDEARAVFETALSLDPENLIALRHLGDIARQTGDTNSARNWYQRVLEADPRNDEIAQIVASLGTAAPAEQEQAPSPQYDGAVTAETSTTLVMHAPEPPQLGGGSAGDLHAGNMGLVEHFDSGLTSAPSAAQAPTVSPFAPPTVSPFAPPTVSPFAPPTVSPFAPPPLAPPSLSSDHALFDLTDSAPSEMRVSGPSAHVRDDAPPPVPHFRETDALPFGPPPELLPVADTHAPSDDALFEVDAFAITAQPETNAQPTREDDGHLDGAFIDESAFEPFSLGTPLPPVVEGLAEPSHERLSIPADAPDVSTPIHSLESAALHEEPPPLPFVEMSAAEAISAHHDVAEPAPMSADEDELATFLARHTQHIQMPPAAEEHAEAPPVESAHGEFALVELATPQFDNADILPAEAAVAETAADLGSTHEELTTSESADSSDDSAAPVSPQPAAEMELDEVEVRAEPQVHEVDVHAPSADSGEEPTLESEVAAAVEQPETTEGATAHEPEKASGVAVQIEPTPPDAAMHQPEQHTDPTLHLEPAESSPVVDAAPPVVEDDSEVATPTAGEERSTADATSIVEAHSAILAETHATDAPAPQPSAPVAPEPEHREPAPPATTEAFVTETMAELYLQQGHLEPALDIYKKLVEQRPDDPQLRDRLGVIERRVHGAPSPSVTVGEHEMPSAPVVVGPTIRDFLSVLVTRVKTSSAPGVGEAVTAHVDAAVEEYSAPLVDYAAPSLQHDASVEHDGSMTEHEASSTEASALEASAIEHPAFSYDADVVTVAPPAEESSAVAGAASHGSIDALFPDAHASVSDATAASALADAFAAEDGRDVPSIFEQTVNHGEATHEEPASPPATAAPVHAESGDDGFSFDQFFAGDVQNAAPIAQRDAEPAPGDAADVAQFNQWLSGLKKPS